MYAREDLVVKDEVMKGEELYAFICQLAKANKKEILAEGLEAKIIDIYDLSKVAEHLALEKVVDIKALNLLLSMGADSTYAVCGAAFAGDAYLVDYLIDERGADACLAAEAAAYGGQFALVEHVMKHHPVLLLYPITGALNGNQLDTKEQAYQALMSFQDPKLRLRFAKEVDKAEGLDFKLSALLVAKSVKGPKYGILSSIGAFFQHELHIKFGLKCQSANSDKKKLLKKTLSS